MDSVEVKTCCRCDDEKPIDEFNKNKRYKDGRRSDCKSCQGSDYKKYYKKNRFKISKRQKIYYSDPEKREQHRQFKKKAVREHVLRVYRYLSTHPCSDCPEADPVVLEFDHVRGEKKAEISTLVYSGRSWEVIQEEIEKCEVRCANCHRRKTIKQFGRLDWVLKELAISCT